MTVSKGLIQDDFGRRSFHRGGDCVCGSRFIQERVYLGFKSCARCDKLLPYKVKVFGFGFGRAETDATIEEIAVAYLRNLLTEAEKRWFRWLRLMNPIDWVSRIHFGEGKRIRNSLRKVGLDEEAFGIGNLDDVYVGLLSKAIAR